jgi:hypothetical protein
MSKTTFQTEGARRLAKLVKAANGVTRFARLHGFGQSTVSRWVLESRVPATELAVALQWAVGIPVEAWTQRPHEEEK